MHRRMQLVTDWHIPEEIGRAPECDCIANSNGIQNLNFESKTALFPPDENSKLSAQELI